MRTFYIPAYKQKYIESEFSSQSLLHNLEIMAKEVKIRKPRTCSVCHSLINKGEKALRTIQRVDSRSNGYYYNTYCSDCYMVKEEARN